MARRVRIGAHFKAIVSWPGVSGPSRAKDTRKRFQCLVRGASLVGDSPHEAGYDSGEAGYDSGEARYDSGEARYDGGIAMSAPMRTSRVMTGGAGQPQGSMRWNSRSLSMN